MRRAALAILLCAQAALGQSVAPNGAGVTSASIGLVTSAAVQLYVDPTGADSNACTATGTAACLTIQGAINKVPKTSAYPVNITVAAGTYTGGNITGFNIPLAANADLGSYINIEGTYSTATAATGSATGTATAGTAGSTTTFGTMTDSGATWTVNDFKGKMIEILTGTGSPQRTLIDSNTATAITVVGTWVAPANGSTYRIEDWGSVVNTTTDVPAVLPVTGTTTAMGARANGVGAGFNTYDNITQTGGPGISIRGFKFTETNGFGVRFRGPAYYSVKWCNFSLDTSSIYGRVAFSAGAFGDVSRSYFATNAGTNVTDIQIADPGASLINMVGLFFDNVDTALSANGNWSLSASDVVTSRRIVEHGIQWSRGSISATKMTGATCFRNQQGPLQYLSIDTSSIVCTGTAFQIVYPGAVVVLTSLTGTGNGTLIDARRGAKVYIDSTVTADGNCAIDNNLSDTCAHVSASYTNAAGNIRWSNLETGTFIGEPNP